MLLRINRAGSFKAKPDRSHPSQCGKVGKEDEYGYFVTIEASNLVLTEAEGYVMENAWVDGYFQDTYTNGEQKFDSCEAISQRAVDHFLRLFTDTWELRNIDVRRIMVRIHGTEFSFIEAEWKANIL